MGWDVSIVDVFWGPGYLVISLAALLATNTFQVIPQDIILIILCVFLYSTRLALHLLLRKCIESYQAGKIVEDHRYTVMRQRRPGNSFWWRSLYVVFLFQTTVLWIVTIPLQIGITAYMHSHSSNSFSADQDSNLSIFDLIKLSLLQIDIFSLNYVQLFGFGLFILGFIFESVSDTQLLYFKTFSNKQVLKTGLWAYSRHPNYFGQILIEYSFWILAVGANLSSSDSIIPWHVIGTLFSPVLMNYTLLYFTGADLNEATILSRSNSERVREYQLYRYQTPRLIPWFPKDITKLKEKLEKTS